MIEDGWRVMRHSGRRDGEWRLIYEGAEDQARYTFSRSVDRLRQGGLRLVSPRGEIAVQQWGPALRTRW